MKPSMYPRLELLVRLWISMTISSLNFLLKLERFGLTTLKMKPFVVGQIEQAPGIGVSGKNDGCESKYVRFTCVYLY